ncbi:MAG: hydroxyacylglutathione hydrolase [Pseudomonadota bacterium]
MPVLPLPAFDDNYIWLLRAEGDERAVVVDPGDEEPVIDYLEREGLTLVSILVTHRHGDHVGGIPALCRRYSQVRVQGPSQEPIRGLTHPLREGQRVDLPFGGVLRVLEVPGHTRGHLAYAGEGMLFCGDVLFGAGCGRVFEGTLEQMAVSLERLAALPGETRVYCAHEYTLANLGFARWVEPDNAALQNRTRQAEDLRARQQPTVPSTLAEEHATNPFLRTREETVVKAAERHAGHSLTPGTEVFAVLRQWKDREYDSN